MIKSFLHFLFENPTEKPWDVQPLKGWTKGMKDIRNKNNIMKRVAEFESIIRLHPEERTEEHKQLLTNKYNHHPVPFPATRRGQALMTGFSAKVGEKFPRADYRMMQTHVDAGGGTIALTAHKVRGEGPDVLLVGVGSHTDYTG